jgi:hypothetical protein
MSGDLERNIAHTIVSIGIAFILDRSIHSVSAMNTERMTHKTRSRTENIVILASFGLMWLPASPDDGESIVLILSREITVLIVNKPLVTIRGYQVADNVGYNASGCKVSKKTIKAPSSGAFSASGNGPHGSRCSDPDGGAVFALTVVWMAVYIVSRTREVRTLDHAVEINH